MTSLRAADRLPHGYDDRRIQPLRNIQLRPAAELDHADALALFDGVAFLDIADDPPGDEPDDLLDHCDRPIAMRLDENDGVRSRCRSTPRCGSSR